MTKYIEFQTIEEGQVLIEIDEKEAAAGVTKAGLREIAGRAVSKAQTIFEDAIKTALKINVETFYNAVQELPHPPAEMEITFGLKATGELGNVAISKAGAEANYTVKLAWKQGKGGDGLSSQNS